MSRPNEPPYDATSLEAYEKIKATLGERHQAILDLLADEDLSTETMADQLGVDLRSLEPRVAELRARGFLRPSGKRNRTSKNKSANRWALCTGAEPVRAALLERLFRLDKKMERFGKERDEVQSALDALAASERPTRKVKPSGNAIRIKWRTKPVKGSS